MIRRHQLAVQVPVLTFTEEDLRLSQTDRYLCLSVSRGHTRVNVPHTLQGVDDTVLAHANLTSDPASHADLIAVEMVFFIHHYPYGLICNLRKRCSLQGKQRDQLLASVAAAGMHTDNTYDRAGYGALGVNLLQMRGRAVVPQRQRPGSGPFGDNARAFRRKGVGEPIVTIITFCNVIRFRETLLDIAPFDALKGFLAENRVARGELIVLKLIVNPGRAVLQRFLAIQNKGQLLIFHLNELERLVRDFRGGCRNERHTVAHKA